MRKKYVSILISMALLMTTLAIVPGVSAYDFPSTNEDNKNGTNTARPGVIGPHVNLVEAGPGYVTLEFNMPESYLACFEYRTDGDASQITDPNGNFNPEIDELYPYYCLNGPETRTETIDCIGYVEIRSVFGGERDWDFDWTRFDALPQIKGLAREDNKFSGTIPVSVDYEASSGDDGQGDGGNSAPVIKCKFEVAEDDAANTYTMPTGHPIYPSGVDADLTEEGTQIDTLFEYQGWTWVGYYVVVYDSDSNDEINQVAVDVYHPDGELSWNDYNYGQPRLGDCSFKYDVVLQKVNKFEYIDFLEFVHSQEINGNDIIKYNEVDHVWNVGSEPDQYATQFDEVIAELLNCEAELYYGRSKLHYCQPAGYYQVHAKAHDIHGGLGTLDNCMEYTLGVGIETDFSSIDFGSTRFDQLKWLHGDWIWGNDQPTIRNIGNWDTKISVEFDDLGMGKSDLDGDGEPDDWNVVYDARMGDAFGAPKGNKSYEEKNNKFIEPFEDSIIPVDQWYRVDSEPVLRKCNTSKISFGILIRKILPYQEYTGTMTLSVNVPRYVYQHYDGLPTCPKTCDNCEI